MLKALGIDVSTPTIAVFTSPFGVGKSTIMASLIKELADNGKRILILGDDNYNHWAKRLKNLEVIPNGNVVYRAIGPDFNFKTSLYPTFDCLVIDSYLLNTREKLTDVFNFVKVNGITLFTTSQTRKDAPTNLTLTDIADSSKKSDVADIVVSIKKAGKIKNLLTRLKYFLFGWFLKKPNITLSVIKNRRAKPVDIDTFIDFEKINKELTK
jgi:hypothetical protein